MTAQNHERYRELKHTHQRLVREWRRVKGPCIICGERAMENRDHLPPKVLFPQAIRSQDTEFFTFPVCMQCNNSSSDADFLFSVMLSLRLNQESIMQNRKPDDSDLLALEQQMQMHLQDSEKGRHRVELLHHFIGIDPCTGRCAINIDLLPINQTLIKIVKSIYWLHTDGDILQRHHPGWWIRADIDTSKEHFIAKHLKTTHADLYWGDRFITHYSVGHPDNGVGGMISCSLHFYTKQRTGEGMSWLVVGSPSLSLVEGESLYEISKAVLGPPTIEPWKAATEE